MRLTEQEHSRCRITRNMRKNALRIKEVEVLYAARILVINLSHTKRKKSIAERRLMEAVFGLVEIELRNQKATDEVIRQPPNFAGKREDVE